jgi:hypothetical protein
MKPKNPTQKQRAVDYIAQVKRHLTLSSAEVLRCRGPMAGLLNLRDYLGEALCREEADGSLDEKTWAAAKNVYEALNDFEIALLDWDALKP